MRSKEEYLKFGEINTSFKRNLIKMSENTWIHTQYSTYLCRLLYSFIVTD